MWWRSSLSTGSIFDNTSCPVYLGSLDSLGELFAVYHYLWYLGLPVCQYVRLNHQHDRSGGLALARWRVGTAQGVTLNLITCNVAFTPPR